MIAERHLRAGFYGLAFFVALGAVLELLHAIKAPFYLDAGHETTRLLLRLAHAHGTLVALVNVVVGLAIRGGTPATPLVSKLLLASLVLLPGGFLLGGLWAHGGDPGLGIVLVPLGAVALFASTLGIAIRS